MAPVPKLRQAEVLALAVVLAGCGSINTRFDNSPIGRYPMQAVCVDGYCISRLVAGPVDLWGTRISGVTVAIVGLFSLPVDLCVDVVLLPVDAVAWALGEKKVLTFDERHPPRSARPR